MASSADEDTESTTVGELEDSATSKIVFWHVRHFLSLPSSVDRGVDSPEFTFANATWGLQMYPRGRRLRGTENSIDIQVVRRKSFVEVHKGSVLLGLKHIFSRKDDVSSITDHSSKINGDSSSKNIDDSSAENDDDSLSKNIDDSSSKNDDDSSSKNDDASLSKSIDESPSKNDDDSSSKNIDNSSLKNDNDSSSENNDDSSSTNNDDSSSTNNDDSSSKNDDSSSKNDRDSSPKNDPDSMNIGDYKLLPDFDFLFEPKNCKYSATCMKYSSLVTREEFVPPNDVVLIICGLSILGEPDDLPQPAGSVKNSELFRSGDSDRNPTVGFTEEMHSAKAVHWKIPSLSHLDRHTKTQSPPFTLSGAIWRLQMCSSDEGETVRIAIVRLQTVRGRHSHNLSTDCLVGTVLSEENKQLIAKAKCRTVVKDDHSEHEMLSFKYTQDLVGPCLVALVISCNSDMMYQELLGRK